MLVLLNLGVFFEFILIHVTFDAYLSLSCLHCSFIMKKILLALGTSLILLHSACGSGVVPESGLSTSSAIDTLNPMISFFSFSIYKKGSETRIELIDAQKVAGEMKKKKESVRNQAATLTATFYYEQELLDTQSISHPLVQSFEALGDGMTASSQMVTQAIDSTTFFMRVQYEKPITSIRFSENIDGSRNELKTIKL